MVFSLAITEVVTDLEKILNSEYVAKIFEPYASSELDRFKRLQRKFNFQKSYVSEVDPELNYGRSHRVYIESLTTDGMRVLNEVSAISMLSNSPMRVVNIKDNRIEFTKEFIQKDEEGRNKVIKEGLLVF